MITNLRSSLWTGTVAFAVLAVLASWQTGFTVAADSVPLIMLLGVAVTICLMRPPASFGALHRPVQLLDGFVLLTVISASGAVISYAIIRNTSGFADQLLARSDAAIGFSWPAIYRFTAHHPLLQTVMLRSYLAFSWLPFLVFGLLYRAGRLDRIYRYLLAHGLSLAATLTLFCFLPARAAFAFYSDQGMSTGPLPSYDATIAGLRDGSLTAIDLAKLDGLVTFPSFHATMAIQFAWAAWPASRAWRGPLVILNVLMWLSAVPIGGHYIVDLFGGTLIAVCAIVMANRWVGCEGKDELATVPTIMVPLDAEPTPARPA